MKEKVITVLSKEVVNMAIPVRFLIFQVAVVSAIALAIIV